MFNTNQPVARALVVAAALVIGAGYAAAGGSPETEPAASDSETGALTPVTLMLDWVPNVNHVGLFVARDLGFFEDQGLDVTIIEPGEVYATSAVVGGQADFGIDFQENVTLLRSDGVPIVSIAAVMQTNTSGFAVRAGEGIEGPEDFAGLTYGTFNSPYERPTLSSLVSCAGGDPESIEYVTAGTDLLAMLQQEIADLVWIYYGTQGFQAERIGLEIDYFPLNEYAQCIPDYYTPIVITSQRTASERPELTRRFVAALAAAHRAVAETPVRAAEVLAAAVPELDAGELRASVPWVAERMVVDGEWGQQRLSVWSQYAEWLAEQGVLEGEFDPESAFTTEFLPQ